MIALDALSAYWIASHTPEDRVLNVTLSSQGRNGFKSHVLQLNNHQAQGLEAELQVNCTLTGAAGQLGLVCGARTSRPPLVPHSPGALWEGFWLSGWRVT